MNSSFIKAQQSMFHVQTCRYKKIREIQVNEKCHKPIWDKMGLVIILSLEAKGKLVSALRIHIISNLKNKTAEANLYISCAPNVPATALIVARKADVEEENPYKCFNPYLLAMEVSLLVKKLLTSNQERKQIASQERSRSKSFFFWLKFYVLAVRF
jgi:predicted DNA-binding ribbon-helix-helix protein